MSERPNVAEAKGWVGARLDEMGGAGVGKIEGVYVDERSGEPEWLLARLGRFGRYALVPARDAVEGVGEVWVPYDREVLRGAPKFEPRQELDPESEAELSAYYETDRAQRLAERGPATVTARAAP